MPPSIFDSFDEKEEIDCSWDWDVIQAIYLRAKSEDPLPYPERRFWWFKSGLGVAATTNRNLLVAGLVFWSALPWVRRGNFQVPVSQELFPTVPFPATDAMTPDEVEAYIHLVKKVRFPV